MVNLVLNQAFLFVVYGKKCKLKKRFITHVTVNKCNGSININKNYAFVRYLRKMRKANNIQIAKWVKIII